MARGTTLGELVVMLRAELGESLQANLGLNTLETYKMRLARVQRRLYLEWDWQLFRSYTDVPMKADTKYYDFPVIPETVERIEVIFNEILTPLRQGINGVEYSTYRGDEKYDPPNRWDYYLDPTGADSQVDNNQFEIWPTPTADDVSVVRFYGKRQIPDLTSNSDKAILDDDLIVMFAAASLTKKKDDRQMKMAEAQSYYKSIKKQLANTDVLRRTAPDAARAPTQVLVGLDTTS